MNRPSVRMAVLIAAAFTLAAVVPSLIALSAGGNRAVTVAVSGGLAPTFNGRRNNAEKGEDASWREFVGSEAERNEVGFDYTPRLLKLAASLRPPGSRESAKLRGVTVKIMRQLSNGTVFTGAGIIVSRGAYGEAVILTARHVLDSSRAGPLNASLLGTLHVLAKPTAQNIGYPARVADVSDVGDIALITADVPVVDSAIAEMAESEPTIDSHALVVGHPHGDAWVVSPAIYHPRPGRGSLLCPTCYNGDSGGGVFSAEGYAFGIVVERKVWHLGFDGPHNRAHDVVTTEYEPLPVIRRLLAEYGARSSLRASGPEPMNWTTWPFAAGTR